MSKMYTQSFQDFYYAFYCFNSKDATVTGYFNFSEQTNVEAML
jgi:hypothetical protein